MGHPLIDEFCRIAGVQNCQSHYFRRFQRELRDQINPMLDERDALIVQNAELKAQIAALESEAVQTTAKAKRREAAAV